jgi:hypothetical protein
MKPARGKNTIHIRQWLHRDAYALLEAECPPDAHGRRRGIGRVLERCIFSCLGGKYLQEKPKQD